MEQVDAVTALAKEAPAPLRQNREFSLLWMGAGFSYLGSRVTALVYPMLVLWGGGSTTTAGLLGFTALVPQLVVQLPAGAHVDRRDRRRLMLACELGCVLALGSLAIPVALGRLWLPQLFAVAFVEGSLMVVYQIAERSAVPQLVTPDQLGSAYSRNEARTRGASVLGQPTGTGLFAIGNAVPLFFSVGTHLMSLTTLLRIRRPLQAERGAPPGDMRSEIAAGLAWLWRQPFLRTVLLVISGTNMLYQMLSFAILPLFHDEGRPKGLVGVVLACSAVGGLVGALTAARWMRFWSLRRILLAGIVVWAVVTPLLAVTHNIVAMGVLFAASGYAGGVFNVPAIVYLMRITPPTMQGRVSSVANLVSFGAIALGWVAAGLLLTIVTPRQGIGVVGAAMALVATCAVLSPAIRGAAGAAETKPLG
jgi:MFS family permease